MGGDGNGNATSVIVTATGKGLEGGFGEAPTYALGTMPVESEGLNSEVSETLHASTIGIPSFNIPPCY